MISTVAVILVGILLLLEKPALQQKIVSLITMKFIKANFKI